jgi:hypothetical protein
MELALGGITVNIVPSGSDSHECATRRSGTDLIPLGRVADVPEVIRFVSYQGYWKVISV